MKCFQKNQYLLKKIFNKDTSPVEKSKFFFQLVDEFNDLWNNPKTGSLSLINKINIKELLSSHFVDNDDFINRLAFSFYSFEKKIGNEIFSLPFRKIFPLSPSFKSKPSLSNKPFLTNRTNIDINGLYYKSWLFIKLIDNKPNEVYNFAMELASKLAEIYKNYLIELVRFYKNHTQFKCIFIVYPIDLLDTPFFNYYNNDTKILNYTIADFNFLFLQLIEKIFFSNYFFIQTNDIKDGIIKALYFFESKGTIQEANLAYKIRHKIHKYKGIKRPKNLIFYSRINNSQSTALTEYVRNRFFDISVDLSSLVHFFMGKIIVNNSESGFNNYKISIPFVVKSKKLGYVTFILNYLQINDYIICDNLWDNLDYNKFFVNHSNKAICANEFARALRDKKQNDKSNEFNKSNKFIKDPILDELSRFLNTLFPPISNN